MTSIETNAIVALTLLAAFVDGDKHEREREEIKRIAEGLTQGLKDGDSVHLPSLYQDVLMKRASLTTIAKDLSSAESKQLGYEMAVCVCDADGAQSPAEQRFLEEVRTSLGLAAPAAKEFASFAEEMASAPLAAAGFGASAAGSASTTATPTPANVTSTVDEAEIDRSILSASITNGALELLPETLSTMAIIPLQMKLVYQIGKTHGFELDRGHIKDFLATAGVGMTSQFLEQAGRKLLGGLLGKMGGGLARGLGNQAVSSGMSFASTYALGHVAKRYYAGGRTLSTDMLKQAYASVMVEGRNLQTQYLPMIQDKARTLDAAKVLAMVRGK
ncbi:MAG: TerB family tellurite resistance protein [Pseudomonadota bacterium]